MSEDDQWTEAVCRDIASRQRYLACPPKIADVLSQLMARRGYARVRSTTQLDDVWRQVVGDSFAESCRPGNQRRGVLEVVVTNSAVMQELMFMKRKILKELKRLVEDEKIRDVRFRVGPIA